MGVLRLLARFGHEEKKWVKRIKKREGQGNESMRASDTGKKKKKAGHKKKRHHKNDKRGRYWLITFRFGFFVSIKHAHKEHEIHTKATLGTKELDQPGKKRPQPPSARNIQDRNTKENSHQQPHPSTHPSTCPSTPQKNQNGCNMSSPLEGRKRPAIPYTPL